MPADATPEAIAAVAQVELVHPNLAAPESVRLEVMDMPRPTHLVVELVARFG